MQCPASVLRAGDGKKRLKSFYRTLKKIIPLTIFLLMSLSAGFIGSQFRPGQWYQSLVKPSWNPPSYIFAPVWTLLYVMMGIAAWLVWKEKRIKAVFPALLFFVIQLILNTIWSCIFFGLHRIDLAFLDITVLWAAVLVTMLMFWKISKGAGMLFLPYMAWLSFAALLNLQLLRLNP